MGLFTHSPIVSCIRTVSLNRKCVIIEFNGFYMDTSADMKRMDTIFIKILLDASALGCNNNPKKTV